MIAIALVGCGGSGGGPGTGPGADAGDDALCGNGVRDPGESCDGSDLGPHTCRTLGFAMGEVSCSAECIVDVTHCIGEGDEFDLDGAAGCEGIFNPGQVLTYHVQAGSLGSDGPGRFRCGDGPTLDVEVESKRGGGFKIDFNQYDDAQSYFGIEKLVFDNSHTSAAEDIVSQYLSWRLMNLAGVVSSRAGLAEVHVNGQPQGLLVIIEAVDKRMLKHRFGDDDGWLYKKSGGGGDGLKTHETDGLAEANPYDDYLCFWRTGNACAVPGDVAVRLPDHVHLEQALRLGAVNAFISNSDSPIFKDNNYYYYDWPGKRYYLPWDLDTVMRDGGYPMIQRTSFAAVLLAHWEGDYRAIVSELIAGPLSLAAIEGELDRVRTVAGPAIGRAGGNAGEIVGRLEQWWTQRHATGGSQF
jgi:hypothetical protein